MNLNILIVLIVLLCSNESWSQLSCMDENNKPVDWFIALKYPDSYDFVYLAPGIVDWKTSSSDLSLPDNMVGLTLNQSYNREFFYAYYNDEPARLNWANKGYYSERGHLKGILNFGKSSGYWLIHSVPKFPYEGSYRYCEGEEIYGQSFICVTVGTKNLSPIVQQLLMMQSTVYSHYIPTDFSQDDTLMYDLQRFVNNRKVTSRSSIQLPLTTSDGVSLSHFGKSGEFGDDLYAGLIAPSLQTSIYAETWIRQDRLYSACDTKYKVYNVNYVSLPGDTFKETKDHSKWAVSTSVDRPYVCIGDINRMSSQFKRGGGSMCLSNADIWKTFSNIVNDYEHCDNGWVLPNIL